MKKVTECCILRKAKVRVRVLMFMCARMGVCFDDEVRDSQIQLTKSPLWVLLRVSAFYSGDLQLEQIYQNIEQRVG